LLSVAELGEALSIAFTPSLNPYLAVRTWLRRRLAEYLDRPAGEFRFEHDDDGRLIIASPETDLDFDLAWSDDTAVLAVGFRRGVGVDLRRTDDQEHDADSQALTPEEQTRYVRALHPARSLLQFLARKTARGRAAGGAAGAMDVDTSGLSPVAVDGYLITDLDLGDDLVASVAVPEGSAINLIIDDAASTGAHRLQVAVAG
jgi:hypothetical protein